MKDRYSIVLAVLFVLVMVWVTRLIFIWWEAVLVGLVVFLVVEHLLERGFVRARGKTFGLFIVALVLVWAIEAGGLLYPKTVPYVWYPTPNGTRRATICRDGVPSFTQEPNTTCSWHGGIAQ
jgi:hypothetical protein